MAAVRKVDSNVLKSNRQYPEVPNPTDVKSREGLVFVYTALYGSTNPYSICKGCTVIILNMYIHVVLIHLLSNTGCLPISIN
jgi:hypothetical protein